MGEEKSEQRAAIASFIEKAHATIDCADGYYILGVDRDAAASDIRAAYYRLASRLHPDLHGDWMPLELRRKLTTVYSRVVEAYKVLSNGEHRRQYDEGLAQGKLRWDANEAAKPKLPHRPEDDVENHAARRFFLLGHNALLAGDGKSALLNLELALSMEPENPTIAAALAKARELVES